MSIKHRLQTPTQFNFIIYTCFPSEKHTCSVGFFTFSEAEFTHKYLPNAEYRRKEQQKAQACILNRWNTVRWHIKVSTAQQSQINILMKKSEKTSLQRHWSQDLIKARLVDVWGHGASSQVGQVESCSHGNKAGCHLQDGQQPVCGVDHTVWCLEGTKITWDSF